jgi:hypothetical protein
MVDERDPACELFGDIVPRGSPNFGEICVRSTGKYDGKDNRGAEEGSDKVTVYFDRVANPRDEVVNKTRQKKNCQNGRTNSIIALPNHRKR